MKLRGLITLVKTMEGPRKTSSSSVTPWYTDTLFWIFTPLPIFTLRSMKTFWPIIQFSPISEEGMIWVKCQTFDPAPMLAPASITAEE